jgi:hypothetical protein
LERTEDLARATSVLATYLRSTSSYMRSWVAAVVSRYASFSLCARAYPASYAIVLRGLAAAAEAHTDGTSAARQRARWLVEHGKLSTARVDRVDAVGVDHGARVTNVTLTLTPDDGRPYVVVVRHIERSYGAKEGLDIYVRVNPGDPNDVMLEPL